jgi:2-polyprenyl-6-methoxyphenol hydroxylase-like FAD-dependent oxidoreductase
MQHNSIVLVGDAAHSVHPLAGQGLNLGLHDALSLVAHMSRSAAAGGAVDDFVALQASAAYLQHFLRGYQLLTPLRPMRESVCSSMRRGELLLM